MREQRAEPCRDREPHDRRWWPTPWIPPAIGVLAAVAGWWLVGDLSFRAPPGVRLDHLVDPPPIGPRVTTGTGLAAATAASALLVTSAVAAGRGRIHRSWLTVVVVLAMVGLLIGWGGRVVTAGGIGANIGAGLVILLLGPMVGIVLLGALVRAVQLTRGGRSR